jgi:hypothetical protein
MTDAIVAARARFPIAQQPAMIGGIVQPFAGNIQRNAANLADRYQDSQGQVRNEW